MTAAVIPEAPPTPASSTAATTVGRQIPIVCPGHTRPLAELQFCTITEPPIDGTTSPTPMSADDDQHRTLLISACHDKLPMLRDANTGDWIGTFVGHKGAVWSTRLDPTGCLAATASGDFSVQVWDAITGMSLYSFAHKHVVKTVDWSSNSKRIATGGHEGLLRIYDVTQPTDEPLIFVQSTKEKVSISKCIWLNETTVLAAGEDGIIRFWNVDEPDLTKQLLRTIQVNGGVRDMELTTLPTTQQTILTVASGQHVTFFDMSTYQILHSHLMPINFREEGGASLHPQHGTKFIAGGGRKGGSMALGTVAGGIEGEGGQLGSDLLVYVFDFTTGKEIECHKGHHGPVRCLRYHPDGMSYATGSEDGTIRIWKTADP
jgi:serine-threonine kinase receptor-associated protein